MGMEILQRGGIALVFGMEWFPLLGNQPEGQARSLARRRRASHRVVCAGGAAAVGLLRARRLPRKGKSRYCSAAAVFAGLHPMGTVAAVLTLPGDRRWLVAVHEGAVMTRCDHLHDASAPVNETLSLLREAHPGLEVLSEPHQSLGLLDGLFAAAQESGELVRTGGVAGGPAAWLALPLMAAGAALLAGGGGLPGMGRADAPPVVDAQTAWQTAVAASVRPHRLQGVAGLQAALDAIHAVPVNLAGWHLTEVECRPGGDTWRCRTRYRRGDGGNNQGFMDAADSEWTLSFDPMQGAEAVWSVPMPARGLDAVALRAPRQNEARLVSALQVMLPAFTELRLEAPQALPLRVPLDARQQPIARPPGIVTYQRRLVRLQAPLRSLSLLLPEAAHMSWDRILLQVAAVDEPSLRSSSLRVSLSGVLYEIEPEPGRDSRVSS